MKERVTITLERDVLEVVDGMVDKEHIKNRSHAIELLVKKSVGAMCPRKAIILAGGKGTRLRPITHEIPKPLIPVQGQSLIEHLLDLFKRHGVQEVMLAIGYKKEKIMEYFGNGERFGLKISYIEEDEPLGTAGPLLKARDFITEPVIVTNGDELKDVNLDAMYDLHKKNSALATIALTTVADPSAYGVADLSGNRIVKFVEKPPKEEAPSNLINAGLYIIQPEVLSMIPEGGFAMLEKDVFPKIAELGKLYGYPFSGQWFDTGNIERYERAIANWKGLPEKAK